jgi:GDP-D-mannose dehydratase
VKKAPITGAAGQDGSYLAGALSGTSALTTHICSEVLGA